MRAFTNPLHPSWVATLALMLGIAAGATPAGAGAAQLAFSYSGTAHNTTYNVTTALALTDVTEGAEGAVGGQLVVQPPLYGSGPFAGMLADGRLTFTVTPGASTPGETSATFVGQLSASGGLSGTYTTYGEGTQMGTWEVAPGQSGPVLGASMTLAAVSGEVTFRLPGARSFSRLVGSIVVPNGTEVDAIGGSATVTVVSGAIPALETALLYGGEFIAEQESTAPYETRFVLSQQLACGAAAARVRAAASARTAADPAVGSASAGPRAASASHAAKSRHLWAHDTGGKFGTTGRYVSTSVEGTRWLTSDTCGSSSVRVTEGTVAVKNLQTGRTVVVRAGSRYRTAGRSLAGASSALGTVDAYWAAIRRHDFETAYGYLLPGSAGSRSGFVAGERRQGIERVSFRGRLVGSSGSGARVQVLSLITHDRRFGCRTWSGSYDLVGHEGHWLIRRADLTIRSCSR
jgi:hypothetical protein